MTDFNRLHEDMRQQNENIKDLTNELSQLNVVLQEVVTDNKYRDIRITECEENIGDVRKEILGIHKYRSEFREEYLPTLDRS